MVPHLFAGLSGYRRVVDDVVIFDSEEDKHAAHTHQFLQRCGECMITLNKDNWEYAKPQVTVAGFQMFQDGYSIDTAITNASSEHPLIVLICVLLLD